MPVDTRTKIERSAAAYGWDTTPIADDVVAFMRDADTVTVTFAGREPLEAEHHRGAALREHILEDPDASIRILRVLQTVAS